MYQIESISDAKLVNEGLYFVCTTYNSNLYIWEVETGNQILKKQIFITFEKTEFTYAKDKKWIIIYGKKNWLKILNFTGKIMNEIRLETAITSCEVTSNGKFLFIFLTNNKIKVWNISENKITNLYESHCEIVSSQISFTNNFLVSIPKAGYLQIWYFNQFGQIDHKFHGRTPVIPTQQEVTCFHIADDSEFLITASSNYVKVWEILTGALKLTCEAHVKIISCAISKNYIVGGGFRSSLILWERKSGQIKHIFGSKLFGIQHCFISKNEKFVVSTSRGVIEYWCTESGKLWEIDGGIEDK